MRNWAVLDGLVVRAMEGRNYDPLKHDLKFFEEKWQAVAHLGERKKKK
ncbi:MAG: hypothetical protein V1735_06305 [Nanoarchaeota archaeon]